MILNGGLAKLFQTTLSQYGPRQLQLSRQFPLFADPLLGSHYSGRTRPNPVLGRIQAFRR